MGLSDKLATLNFDRYQSWKASKTQSDDSKPSLMVFKGDVYQGLEAETLNTQDMKFAQKHLRILSGLYGILKPLDVIRPYRLEMGTRLETSNGKNLYEFWGNKITQTVNKLAKENKSKAIVNLASVEYFSVLKKDNLDLSVINPVFKDYKNGKYKIISFFAKKARGSMTRFIIQNRIKKVEDLKGFDLDGYSFSEKESIENSPVFLRKS